MDNFDIKKYLAENKLGSYARNTVKEDMGKDIEDAEAEKMMDFLYEKEEDLNEDWGSSDQATFNQSIHKDLGNPTEMPMPFDSKFESAVESAVDFWWDDWDEYNTDRDGLIDYAKKRYYSAYFPEKFAAFQQMFAPKMSENKTLKEDAALVGNIALGIVGGLAGLWAISGVTKFLKNLAGYGLEKLGDKLQASAKNAARGKRKELIMGIAKKFESDDTLKDMYASLPEYNPYDKKERDKQIRKIADYIKSKLTPEEMKYFKDISSMLRTGDITESEKNINHTKIKETLSSDEYIRMDGLVDQDALASFRDSAYYVIAALREDGFDDEDILEFLQDNLEIAFN